MTPQQFWHTPYGIDDWTPLVGDADGDGHADLIALSPGADTRIEMARTSPLGKPILNAVALRGFGSKVVAAACGPFKRGAAGDVAAVFADGSVRIAWGMAPGTTTFLHNDLAAQIPPEAMPQGATQTAVADFDGDDRADILILDARGRLLLLRNTPGEGGAPGFTPVSIATTLPDARRFVAGNLGGERHAHGVWIGPDGAVSSAQIEKGALGPTTLVTKASPDDHLAIGRFRGANGADLLVGSRLLPGGDPKAATTLPDLPALAVAKDDGPWMVGDVDGNGKDDLVRSRRGHERWGGQDTYVHFAYDPAKEDPGYLSTANDGLPDIWKLGRVKPNGLDLQAMGCKVGHRDAIVEIERFDNVDINDVKNNMARAVRYFASIPLPNPDGTTGIALHVLYREPYPLKDHDKVMGHFDEIFPRPGNRGIVHMMFAEQNGPLVSQINGDHGHFNGHWSEFTHEFGHQLDLVHDGFYGKGTGWSSDTGAAIYPSLMSYTYSYGLNDSGENIGYSDGKRASLVLDPRHLSERLPFPYETVKFLGAEPYHYRLQRTPDDKSTLIDWNWNGVFGEADVAANVNYTHGTDFGVPYAVARTEAAPVVVLHGKGAEARPLLVYTQGATLAARTWMGRNRDTEGGKWSEPTVDYAAAPTGDPSVAYLANGLSWVAYPTAKGVIVRPILVDGSGYARFGTPSLLSDTVKAQPTLVTLDGRLVMLLWHSKSLPVGMRIFRPKGEGLVMTGERPLDLFSDVPVGAVAARPGELWVGRIEIDGKPNGGRTEVIRYAVDAAGGTKVTLRAFMEGTYARHRMTLLWREEGPKLPDGRIYQLSGGIDPGGVVGTDQYLTMNTPYLDYENGWLLHRYRNPGFTSLSAPGACFFQGDILVAFRHYDGDGGQNDRLDVAFYGTGAVPYPTGDFDDLAHVRDYGLSHSIRELTK